MMNCGKFSHFLCLVSRVGGGRAAPKLSKEPPKLGRREENLF